MSVDLLSDVRYDEQFRLSSGTVLKNLEELSNALKTMDSEVFEHHVNEFRNDFSNWIKASVGDSVLADRVLEVKKQDHMQRLVAQRIKELTPEEEKPKAAKPELKGVAKAIEHEATHLIASEEVREGFVNFLLGLLIGFIIGLIIKTLVA
jgi:hypothetical protein